MSYQGRTTVQLPVGVYAELLKVAGVIQAREKKRISAHEVIRRALALLVKADPALVSK